jgi:protein-disulfide isomerase|tara:strand:- start:1081 stop:1773 length:693 start_codon:yes stop_codon:yes gene_type:complete
MTNFFLFLSLLIFKNLSAQSFDEKIREFLLNNPEVILESIENYERKRLEESKRKSNEAIIENNTKLNDSSNGMFSGNANGKEIIIEFFDYNCSYCKKAHQDLIRISKNFPQVKIIYKNLPILSDQSKKLAEISLIIAKKNNKNFVKFHNFLLGKQGRIDDADVVNFLTKLGIDYKEIEQEFGGDYVSSEINKDLKLAQQLALQGTPAFIVKNKLIFGYVGYDELLDQLKN